MRTGYGVAAIVGAVIMVAGSIPSVIIAERSKARSDLLQSELFLVCVAVAVLGLLIIVNAAIGFGVNRLRGHSEPDPVDVSRANDLSSDESGSNTAKYISVSGEPGGS
jgi:hypothetical protein